MMRRLAMPHLPLVLLLGLGCAPSATVPSGGPGVSRQLPAQSWLLAFDRQEGHFHVLFDELRGRWGEDPQLIEARELVFVAEEFYLLADYETAMEMLQQAILLLEEKRRGEKTHP